MQGDILIINENHRKAAQQALPLFLDKIKASKNIFAITVAGESGAGKSEIAASIAKELDKNNITNFIFQQDDYFIHPPKTNSQIRLNDISQVGISEVNLEMLDNEIQMAKDGQTFFEKPLVIFEKNRIDRETVFLEDTKVLIAEGTYTTSLNNVDLKIFIDRDYHDTKASRLERNRERQDDYLEQILLIEHDIISKHKDLADIIITKEFDAIKP